MRNRAEELRTRVSDVEIHHSRVERWDNLIRSITAFLDEYEEYESWGGWKCFLRKNIVISARDAAKDELDNLVERERVRNQLYLKNCRLD